METEHSNIFEQKKIAHLQMIQEVVSRMGNNLFTLRGWMLTLVIALSAAFVEFGRNELQIAVLAIVTIFWMHDAYFLSLERSFRHLYDKVRKQSADDGIDYSMNISEFSKLRDTSIYYCLKSPSLLYFYLPVLILIAIISLTPFVYV